MLHPLQDNEPGIIKLCQFPAIDEHGNKLIEVFTHPDQLHHSYMDKVAAPFLPQVREYIDGLKPDPQSIYALVNALGAFEFWSSNINGDGFEEEHLIHRGPVWGYETFLHYARPFMHHANKGPKARAFGAVELSCWHDHMKTRPHEEGGARRPAGPERCGEGWSSQGHRQDRPRPAPGHLDGLQGPLRPVLHQHGLGHLP
jgi:hypothetical protein